MVNRIFAKQLKNIWQESFTEEAIEVGARKGQCPGGSWRYIAGGALQRRGGRGGEEEEEEEDGRTLRNLTTPHRRGGEKGNDMKFFKNISFYLLFPTTSVWGC